MKQVWPRPEGYQPKVAVCESKSNRLAFSHPHAVGLMVPGFTTLVLALSLVLTSNPGMHGLGWLLLSIAAGLSASAALALVRWLREDRIARTGADAWAEITNVRAGWTSIRFRRPYKLRYRFRDAQGVQHEGRVRMVGDSWDHYTGQPVLVRYDPDDPDKSALVWNALRDERGIPY